jgi:hypothetical protein
MNDDNRRLANHRTEDQPALTPAAPQPIRTSAGWWSRLLDGDQVWGSVDVSPTRYGVTRYRLVVFPPGIDRDERRLLRGLRAWPTWGFALWVLALCVCSTLTPWATITLPSLAWLGIGAYLFARVGAVRAKVRTVSVTRVAGLPDPQGAATYAEMNTLVIALRSADDLWKAGGLSTAEHEAVWWQVYDRLDPDRARTGQDPSLAG